MAAVLLTAALLLSACGAPSQKNDGDGTPQSGGQTQVTLRETGITDFFVDHRKDPICVTPEHLTFAWKMAGDGYGLSQSAYRLVVTGEADGEVIWDSGRVSSDNSLEIPYEGEALKARSRYHADLTVWDQEGTELPHAEASFEMAGEEDLFKEASWIAVSDEWSSHLYPEIGADSTFSLEADIRMPQDRAGLVWGYAEEDQKLYREQVCLNREDNTAYLALQMIEVDAVIWEERSEDLPIPASELAARTSCYAHATGETEPGFHIEIRAEGTHVTTLIGGEEVWTVQIPEERGSKLGVGVHQDRGTWALIDNLCLKDGAGEIISEEDFSDPVHTIFLRQAVEVTRDGWLKANGCLLVTPQGNTRSWTAPIFKKEFKPFVEHGAVQKARLYVAAAGILKISLNRQPLDTGWFSPGNAQYAVRFPYQTFDVTEALTTDLNDIRFTLGHGWFDRANGYDGVGAIWGDHNALIARLDICFEDGTIQSIVTDDSWKVRTDSLFCSNDLWQGECFDASLMVDTRSSDPWQAAAVRPPFDWETEMTPAEGPGIVEVGTLSPREELHPAEGVTVYDFGEEITGVCRITVRGKSRSVVTMRHGEWLNDEQLLNADDVPGTVYTANLMGAQSMDRYILLGVDQEETYTPSYTFHGFRYLQVETTGDVDVEKVVAVILSSVTDRTGEFTCSDDLLNRLYENSYRSMQGCYLSIPMDCPQRSERFGWTGDAQIYSSTAVYNSDLYLFYRDYLQGLADVQDETSGCVGDMAPRNYGRDTRGCGGEGGRSGWADAVVIIPWNLYLQYGSRDILENSYASIWAWIGYLEENAENWVMPAEGYGDHLSQTGIPDECVHTAWAAHSCDLAARIARILDQPDDAERFQKDFEQFRTAWVSNWTDENGITAGGAQTGYAMGIAFGLYPEEMRSVAGERLTESLAYNGNRMSCGFAGLSFLCPALQAADHPELCYEVLSNDQPGTVGYQIGRGATTFWEYPTDGNAAEDGTYRIDGSLNHVAPGAQTGWLYTGCLGLLPDEEAPGWKHFYICPAVDQGLAFARGSYESPYGRIECSWETEGGNTVCSVRIPANTTSTVILPGGGWTEDTTGTQSSGTAGEGKEETRFTLGSGTYSFSKH